MRICIDVGHGGIDSGAVGNGLKEKDITLKIALKVRDLLKDVCEVVMTREVDKYVSLQERCDIANNNKADYFISIHVNSAGKIKATGFESYVSRFASQKSKELGKKIHDSLAQFYTSKGFVDRGFKEAGFYVLNNTKMPAILIENLFINNPNEAKYLSDESFINDLSNAIVTALKEALGIITPVANKTSIVGQSKASVLQAQTWAKKRGAADVFINIAPLYWEIAQKYGIRPEVAYAQAAKESAFGRFGGVLDYSFHNWCGLKTLQGGSNYGPNAHARFPDDRTGIEAHIQHLCAYAGVNIPEGTVIVDPRYTLVQKGIAPYVEDLGGKWAPAQDYGISIVKDYLNDLLNTAAEIPQQNEAEKYKNLLIEIKQKIEEVLK
jgi:N-acetylmuramoyl-L-alanine amidase